MKYKRYGEVNADDIMQRLNSCCKQYHFRYSDAMKLVDWLRENNYERSIAEITHRVAHCIRHKGPTTDLVDQMNKLVLLYVELCEDMHHKVLYADLKTSQDLSKNRSFSLDFWKDFTDDYALDHTGFTVCGDIRLCRTVAYRSPGSKYIIFRFDEWSDSDYMKQFASGSNRGFYNYGCIFLNVRTGSVYLHHVNEARNTEHIPGYDDVEFKAQKLLRSEFLDLVKESEEFFNSLKLEDVNIVDASGKFYLQVARLGYLECALKKYQKAISSVKRISTVAGVKRKAKEVGIDKEQLKVVDKSDDVNFKSNYVSLTSLMEKKVYEKKPWQGGHHKSPCKHMVKEHVRTYKDGHQTVIKSFTRGKDSEESEKSEKTSISIKAVKL